MTQLHADPHPQPHPHLHPHLHPAPRVTPYLRRITLVFALLLAVIWALGAFAIAQLWRVQDKSRDINEQALQSTVVLGQMQTDLYAYRLRENRPSRRVDNERREQARSEMDRLEARMIANSRVYESLDTTDEEMRLFIKFLVNWRALVSQSRTFLAAPPLPPVTAPSPTPSPEAQKMRASFEVASHALDQLIRINVEQGTASLAEAERIYRSALVFILAALILTSIIVVAMLMLITWHESK